MTALTLSQILDQTLLNGQPFDSAAEWYTGADGERHQTRADPAGAGATAAHGSPDARAQALHDHVRRAAVQDSIRKGYAMKIRTHFDPKPIPIRSYDWSATTDDYDGGAQDDEGVWHGGDPIGYGATEAEAVADLMAELELNA